MLRCQGSSNNMKTSSLDLEEQVEVLFLWLVRAIAMGEAPPSPPQQLGCACRETSHCWNHDEAERDPVE